MRNADPEALSALVDRESIITRAQALIDSHELVGIAASSIVEINVVANKVDGSVGIGEIAAAFMGAAESFGTGVMGARQREGEADTGSRNQHIGAIHTAAGWVSGTNPCT